MQHDEHIRQRLPGRHDPARGRAHRHLEARQREIWGVTGGGADGEDQEHGQRFQPQRRRVRDECNLRRMGDHDVCDARHVPVVKFRISKLICIQQEARGMGVFDCFGTMPNSPARKRDSRELFETPMVSRTSITQKSTSSLEFFTYLESGKKKPSGKQTVTVTTKSKVVHTETSTTDSDACGGEPRASKCREHE